MIGFRKEKKGNNIRHEINTLKELLRSIELKPCYGDADLKRKDQDISSLRAEIYDLEKKVDTFAFPIIFSG